MSTIVDALLAELDDAALHTLADRLAPLLTERLHLNGNASPWLNTRQAADYIAAPASRIHDLVQLGELKPRRDGRRLLFRRVDLDAYLEARG